MTKSTCKIDYFRKGEGSCWALIMISSMTRHLNSHLSPYIIYITPVPPTEVEISTYRDGWLKDVTINVLPPTI
jgi:hypothetical protein